MANYKKTAFKVVSYLVVGAAVFYFFQALYKRLDDIPHIHWDAKAYAAVVISVLGILFTNTLTGYLWRALLKDHNVDIRPGKAIQIMLVSQFGKYLPGNVGHFAGRAALASQEGIPVAVTLNTVMVDVVWHLAIGATFAAMAAYLYSDTLHRWLPDHLNAPELVVITVALMFLPWIGITLANRLVPNISRKVGGGQLLAAPTLKTAIKVSAMILLGLSTLGLILKVQTMWLFGVDAGAYHVLMILYVASWTVGYVVPGAPGGVGVREAMMVFLLSPVVGEGTAIGLGIGMRLANMAGDALSFGLGMLSRRHL